MIRFVATVGEAFRINDFLSWLPLSPEFTPVSLADLVIIGWEVMLCFRLMVQVLLLSDSQSLSFGGSSSRGLFRLNDSLPIPSLSVFPFGT